MENKTSLSPKLGQQGESSNHQNAKQTERMSGAEDSRPGLRAINLGDGNPGHLAVATPPLSFVASPLCMPGQAGRLAGSGSNIRD